jgi:hypothetical protein
MVSIKLSSRKGILSCTRAWAMILVLVAAILLAACTSKSTPVVSQGSANETLTKSPGAAESAMLADLHGMVEVKTGDGEWTLAQSGQTLTSGQQIRTGALSNITLAFYDDSRMYLGAEAEVSLDVVDARTSGARVVQLTQVSGESQHEVVNSDDPESRYDINTPNGSGSATGTKFTLLVIPNQLSQFWVDEGAVFVVNANSTVVVAAGQTTVNLVGQPPTEPAFRISGEGQVIQIEMASSGVNTDHVVQIGTLYHDKGVLAARLNMPSSVPEQQSDKVTLCHATGSTTNPYVEITVADAGATNGHAKHAGDIIPMSETGCPLGEPLPTPVPSLPQESQNGKITLCHATGSTVNPYVEITVSVAGATNGHTKHSEDIIPIPAEGCPQSTPPASSTFTSWNIAGQMFSIGANTTIFGNPQPGDWVRFEGYQQADGSRFADRIVLVSHTYENQFMFIGQVTAVSTTAWTISNRVVQVNELTTIEADLTVGDTVWVTGDIAADGTFKATHLSRMETTGSTFQFAGILANIGSNVWNISGIEVTVDANTILNGDFVVGHPVAVTGIINADGMWLALSIDLVTSTEYRFDFIGMVQSINPWIVSGVRFDTADWTEIDADIQIENKVHVTGLVSADGIWVAEQIERLSTEHVTIFDFFGPVLNMNPWNVQGVLLTVDERTTIKGDITLGEMVKVTGWVLEDGRWLATEIKHTGLHLGQGCFMVSSVVQSINGEQIILIDGQTLVRSEALEVVGDLMEASLVRYQFCVDKDGVGQVWRIIVVYQDQSQYRLEEFAPIPDNDKAIICHAPSGDPAKGHTIEIGQAAVSAHMDHGDTMGACP